MKSAIRTLNRICAKVLGTFKRTERLSKSKIKKLVNSPNPVIFEIGCADGSDTLEFINAFDDTHLQFYGFEPEPKNITLINERNLPQNFHLFEGVISDIDGECTFNQSRTDNPEDLSLSGSIMTPKNHLALWDWIYFDQTINVPSTTLDTFCKKNNITKIDFIWCDVQGAEERVIEGGKNTFNKMVKYFYTEYSENEQYEGQPTLKRILELLPNFEVVKDYKSDVLLKNKNI